MPEACRCQEITKTQNSFILSDGELFMTVDKIKDEFYIVVSAGLDIDSRSCTIKINYCPLCGKKLK